MLACSLHVVQDRREWYCLGAESDPESSRLLIIITISDPVSQRTVLLLQICFWNIIPVLVFTSSQLCCQPEQHVRSDGVNLPITAAELYPKPRRCRVRKPRNCGPAAGRVQCHFGTDALIILPASWQLISPLTTSMVRGLA